MWVFLDELSSCNSMGLIIELLCKHSILGKQLPYNIIFIAACNPYRFKEKDPKGKNNRKLAYNVNPLPNSLHNFVLNFGHICKEDEKKYIELMTEMFFIKKLKLNNETLSKEKLDEIKKLTNIIIIESQNFIRDKFDMSLVSLREISRFFNFIIFFTYF